MALGLFMIMVPSQQMFMLGLALVIVGNGLFKPNISTMVGQLYAPRRSAPRSRLHDLLHGHQCRRAGRAAGDRLARRA